MSKYAVITQNDESNWNDYKGDLYHYPSRYRDILEPGCKVVYYKGKMRDQLYESERLSPNPHYFGVGVIGESIEDPDSNKNDWYCEIQDYQEFEKAVPFKVNNDYLEVIPDNLKTNYWRYGVRTIDEETFERILSSAAVKEYQPSFPDPKGELESYHLIEGKQRVRYSTYYERNPYYRNRAIEIHGLTCMACGFDFKEQYGDIGDGYIQVHHNKPLSEAVPTNIDPKNDLSVLCANCHVIVHRHREQTLTVEMVRDLVNANLS
ncbi:MAG: hypothetical protein AB2687_08210 [Candidatus Thiodiazotropha taylori]